jgi:hypothetical protein
MTASTLVTRSDLNALGVLRRRLMVERVGRGLGSDGRKLKPLVDGSPSYLRRTGSLLGGFRVRATDTTVTIEATVDYAPYVEEARPFIAPTDAEQAEVDAEFERRLGIREREFDQRRAGTRRR